MPWKERRQIAERIETRAPPRRPYGKMSHSPYRRNDSASGALRGWLIPDNGILWNDAGRKHALRAAIFSGVPGERFLLAIDPVNTVLELSHPSRKNKYAARVGHPRIWGIYLTKRNKGRRKKPAATIREKPLEAVVALALLDVLQALCGQPLQFGIGNGGQVVLDDALADLPG